MENIIDCYSDSDASDKGDSGGGCWEDASDFDIASDKEDSGGGCWEDASDFDKSNRNQIIILDEDSNSSVGGLDNVEDGIPLPQIQLKSSVPEWIFEEEYEKFEQYTQWKKNISQFNWHIGTKANYKVEVGDKKFYAYYNLSCKTHEAQVCMRMDCIYLPACYYVIVDNSLIHAHICCRISIDQNQV
jgi:hypothetical protein